MQVSEEGAQHGCLFSLGQRNLTLCCVGIKVNAACTQA